MTKPIRPDEVPTTSAIPDAVIEAANRLIASRINKHGEARFTLKELVAETGVDKAEETRMYARHAFDIEPAFQEAGWDAVYDQPGFNESYDAYFVFRRPHG